MNAAQEAPAQPDAPANPDKQIPLAEPIAPPSSGVPVSILADQQSRTADIYTLDGNVVVTYKDYVFHADHITYNPATGELNAGGHLLITGGKDDEHLNASHGTFNVLAETGKLYDVIGTIGVRPAGHKVLYSSANPFTITGRMVVKLGPDHYEVYGGSMTSCRLPKPNWRLYSGKLAIMDDKAYAYNSIFRLHGVPILYLPYVTHPVDSESRQSGFMIPTIGDDSIKGIILGEQYYWVLNRSTDLTLGVQYYSLRGWEQNGSFRYRGNGQDFATGRFSALQDRGIALPVNGLLTNVKQGGQDILFSGRHDFGGETRVVADTEYLSSYVYRQAFTENFNQAVSSDVASTVYITHQHNGITETGLFDRFQSFQSTNPGDEIRILHLPMLDFSGLERQFGNTGLLLSFDASAGGLRRSEQNLDTAGNPLRFNTKGVVIRVDLHPQLAYRFAWRGWNFRPSVGLRNTFYSHSQNPVLSVSQPVPVEESASIDRQDVEAAFELRPPILERTFTAPRLQSLLHRDLRHTIEPVFDYRFVDGVNNFNSILRFDPVDIVSNTNEFEYGLTQRLFARSTTTHACKEGEMPDAPGILPAGQAANQCGGQTKEWLEWRVAQKYFLNSDFGGAATDNRRHVLQTTLDFSGVAFLTVPRNISPVISRLRVRTTDKTDLEWDLDYDPKAGRVASSNVFIDVHQGNYFAGLSHARLDAPGEFSVNGQVSQISDFNQLRLLLGYGTPAKRGLSLAGNAGYDLNLGTLQYLSIQTAYNWDCCGLSLEYRKFQLGTVPSDTVYRFNFTLAGVGTAGNLRRAERLF